MSIRKSMENAIATGDWENFLALNEKHPRLLPELRIGRNDWTTPLHEACRHRPSEEALAGLIRSNPDALRRRDGKGRTPLHVLVTEGNAEVAASAAKVLLESRPEVTLEVDAAGEPPLHAFLKRAMDRDVEDDDGTLDLARAFAKFCPPSLLARDSDGAMPIHLACESSPRLATALVQLCPASCLLTDSYGCTPLHCAVDCDATNAEDVLKLVSLLLRTRPTAAFVTNFDGDTPLHRLCLVDAPFNTGAAALLLKSCPLSASIINRDGHTALSLLYKEYAPLVRGAVLSLRNNGSGSMERPSSTMESLHEFWEAASLLVHKCREPRRHQLHAFLSEHGCPPMVLGLATVMHRSQAKEKDSSGNLPLHIACRTTRAELEERAKMYLKKGEIPVGMMELDLVMELIAIHPEGAKVKDGLGRLPLNILLSSGETSARVISGVVDANPDALHSHPIGKRAFPFALRQHGRDGRLNTIFQLVRGMPELFMGEQNPPAMKKRKTE